MSAFVLAVNSGSSSLKLAIFDASPVVPTAALRIRIDMSTGRFRTDVRDGRGAKLRSPRLEWEGNQGVVAGILRWAEERLGAPIIAVGHRIVHGGPRFVDPVRATFARLRALAGLGPLAPLHQASCLAPVAELWRTRPGLPQVFTFDTAFHRGHAPVVDRLGLPKVWEARGLRRYGFHGLSYAYVASRLAELDPQTAQGRVVAAHLGSGSSLCAMRAGRSVDTTMGTTPLDGLLMATRCGALDPGVLLYLQQAHGLSVEALSDLLYRRSGLLGVSGVSGDVRNLLRSRQPAAHAAVDLFVFRIVREAAALAATLGGLDALVFTGGVGENVPQIRSMVCAQLGWLGVVLDEEANRLGARRISTPASPVAVWVVPTDEERVIVDETRRVLPNLLAPVARGNQHP